MTGSIKGKEVRVDTTPASPFPSSLLFVGLAVIAPLGVVEIDGLTSLGVALAMAVTVISAALIARLIHLGRPAYMRLTFYCYTYVFLGLAAADQASRGSFSRPGSYTQAEIAMGEFIVLVGILTFELVYRGIPPHGRGQRDMSDLVFSPRRAISVAIIGSLVSAVMLYESGGLPVLLSSRQAAEIAIAGYAGNQLVFGPTEYKALGAVSLVLLHVPPVVGSVALIEVWRRGVARRRIGLGVVTSIVLTWALFVSNPVANSRLWSGTVFVSIAVALVGLKRMVAFRTVGLLLLFLLLVLLPYGNAFRYDRRGTIAFSTYSSQLRSADYGSFQDLLNGSAYVDREGLQLGRQLSGVMLFWFPRRWWPDKPQPTGVAIATWIGYSNRNLDSPLWTEGYVDFGLLGTGAYLGVWGWLARRVDDRAKDGTGQAKASAFLPLLALYSIIVLRGSLVPALGPLSAIVILARMTMTRHRRVRLDTGRRAVDHVSVSPGPLSATSRPMGYLR